MTAAAREAQIRRLAEGRARDSAAKTQQALAAVARLHAAGQRVTFAHVAQDAAVSTWFTYHQEKVAAAIRAAQQDQAEHGLHHAPSTQERVSAASLRTDLEHSRDEVRSPPPGEPAAETVPGDAARHRAHPPRPRRTRRPTPASRAAQR